MEKLVEQGLLYDFYGELLTKHQREIYEDAVYQDMSLSEIAEEHGISRQGVHDLIKRCDKILQDYESKLQLVSKFTHAKEKISEITRLTQTTYAEGKTQSITAAQLQERMQRIRRLSEELMKEW